MPDFDNAENDDLQERESTPNLADRRRIQREARKAGNRDNNPYIKGAGVGQISYVPPAESQVTFEFIRAGDLVVDPRYNRDIQQRWVDTIAANFNPDQLQSLIVSRRLFRMVQRSAGAVREEQVFDKNLSASNRVEIVVIAGQHRLLATLKAKGPNFRLPCTVYDGLTEKKEAELFALFDEKVRPHQPWQRHRAHLFGGNPEALEIEQIVSESGLQVFKGQGSQSNREGMIFAVSTLYSIRRQSGADVLRRILNIHFSAWTDNTEGYTSPMLQGTALMLRRFGGYYEWHDEYLAIALEDPAHNPVSIRQRAQGAASGVSATSVAQEVARLEHRYYQQGKKGYVRLPEWNATPREITMASDAAKARAEAQTPKRRGNGKNGDA